MLAVSGSLRRCNSFFAEVYGRPPSDTRRKRRLSRAGDMGLADAEGPAPACTSLGIGSELRSEGEAARGYGHGAAHIDCASAAPRFGRVPSATLQLARITLPWRGRVGARSAPGW